MLWLNAWWLIYNWHTLSKRKQSEASFNQPAFDIRGTWLSWLWCSKIWWASETAHSTFLWRNLSTFGCSQYEQPFCKYEHLQIPCHWTALYMLGGAGVVMAPLINGILVSKNTEIVNKNKEAVLRSSQFKIWGNKSGWLLGNWDW